MACSSSFFQYRPAYWDSRCSEITTDFEDHHPLSQGLECSASPSLFFNGEMNPYSLQARTSYFSLSDREAGLTRRNGLSCNLGRLRIKSTMVGLVSTSHNVVILKPSWAGFRRSVFPLTPIIFSETLEGLTPDSKSLDFGAGWRIFCLCELRRSGHEGKIWRASDTHSWYGDFPISFRCHGRNF